MAPNPYVKQYLMTAGPTPVPPAVSQAMATPMLYHRAPAFVELYERVLAKLPKVFQTSNDVLTFAASGSGAMDSAVANLVRPGTKVLACAAGKFGERWIELDDGLRRRADQVRAGLGRAPGRGRVRPPADRDPGIEVVFATLSETSTGIVNDIQAIAEVVNRHGAILVVDAVSGLGAAELKQDEWGVDVVVAGSQKALMIPPGLAFASRLPEGARLRRTASRRPLLLRLGQDRQVAAQGQLALHARRPALPGPRRRARPDRGGGPGQRLRPPRPARPRDPRRHRRPRPRALRQPGRAQHRRDRARAARARSTAARCPAPCASSASPPTAARTT